MIILILYLLLEPVKRVASALLYPLAYALRRQLRTGKVMRPEYLYEPTFFPLWLMLDDSIHMETGYDFAASEKKYPAWIWNNGRAGEFLLSYWWSAIRNSFVNWNNLSAYLLGSYVGELSHIGSEKNFYKVRQYTNGVRPYCEFYLFGRWNQVGWLKGTPRFEIDIMKRRER